MSPAIDVAALTVLPGGIIAPFVSEFGLTPIAVSGSAQLDATLSVTDFFAHNGTYDVIVVAGDLEGTFTTVQLPNEDWSWGIDGNVVWIRKDDGTSAAETSWGQVKSVY